jgi:hypothetical protein
MKRIKINSKIVKRLIIIISIVLVVLVVAFFVLRLLTPKIGFTEKHNDIFYFPVDYNENIFEDLVYINRFRDVRFDYYGSAVYMNEENYSAQSKEARFFYDYIKSLISGDYNLHKTYFDKSFFARHYIPEKFTMQKLYDIEIYAMSSDIKDGSAYETYKVSYKIQENKGTYRADVSSTEAKPVAITVKKGTELKITSIIPIL